MRRISFEPIDNETEKRPQDIVYFPTTTMQGQNVYCILNAILQMKNNTNDLTKL